MKKLALAALLALSAVPAHAAVIVSVTGTDDATGDAVVFSFTIDPARLPANTGVSGEAIYNASKTRTRTGDANDFLKASVDGQALPRTDALNTASIDSTAQDYVIELDTDFATNTPDQDSWIIGINAFQSLPVTTAYGGVALPDLPTAVADPDYAIGFFISHYGFRNALIVPDRSGTVTSLTYTDTNATTPGGGGPGGGGPVPSTVPEPASWAMMVAGFGLAGAAMRRRPRALASA